MVLLETRCIIIIAIIDTNINAVALVIIITIIKAIIVCIVVITTIL